MTSKIFPLIHLINRIPYSRTLTIQNSHYFDETNYETKYFHENEINTFLDDLTQHDDLFLLRLNIRSLRSNLDDFCILLEGSKHSFNVAYLLKHGLKTISLKQIQIITFQIMKEFIMKEN